MCKITKQNRIEAFKRIALSEWRTCTSKISEGLQGKVIDVAVDLRKDSPTYLQHIAVELSAENNLQLFVPRGFAHGYSVLEDNTIFFYKCDNYYNKESESGIFYADPKLNINWQLNEDEIILSEKISY